MLVNEKKSRYDKKEKSEKFCEVYDKINSGEFYNEAKKNFNVDLMVSGQVNQIKEVASSMIKVEIESLYDLKDHPKKDKIYSMIGRWVKNSDYKDLEILNFYEDLNNCGILRGVSIRSLWLNKE